MKIAEQSYRAWTARKFVKRPAACIVLLLALIGCSRLLAPYCVIDQPGGRYRGLEIGMTKLETFGAIKAIVLELQRTEYGTSWPRVLYFDTSTGGIQGTTESANIAILVPQAEWETRYAEVLRSDEWRWRYPGKRGRNSPGRGIFKVQVNFENDTLVRIGLTRK